jgi:cytochrome c oxidase assembly protein Cox11
MFKLKIQHSCRLFSRRFATTINEQTWRENKSADTVYYVGSVITTFFGLSYLAVPLYKMLCSQTGFDGTPMTAIGC